MTDYDLGKVVGDAGAKGDKGDTGDTGNGIASIRKTSTSGLVDTYTITFTNGNTTTFTVTNGSDASVTVDSALSSTSTNPLQNKAINTALSGKADSSDIPTKTSDLTNDGADGTNVFVANNDSRLSDARTPTSHTHGQVTNDGKITSSAVTVASGDNIVITDANDSSKLKRVANVLATHIKDSNAHTNIGSSASATQGAINTAIDTALGNKASSTHTHTESQITDLGDYIETSAIANNLTTTTSGKVLDARQGKALADLIGDAITYINQQGV